MGLNFKRIINNTAESVSTAKYQVGLLMKLVIIDSVESGEILNLPDLTPVRCSRNSWEHLGLVGIATQFGQVVHLFKVLGLQSRVQ